MPVKKKIVAAFVITIIVVSSLISYYSFSNSGSIIVFAGVQNPQYFNDDRQTYAGWPSSGSITVDIFENDHKIGQTGSEIKLSLGKHIIKFGEYDSEHETPSDIEVNVTPFNRADYSVNYISKFGGVYVATFLRDGSTGRLLYETGSTITIDGLSYPPIQKSDTNLYLKIDSSSLGSHKISFSTIPGYTTPSEQVIFVERGKLVEVVVYYEKILSSEEQHLSWINTKMLSWQSNSNWSPGRDHIGVYNKWVLDNRVSFPTCYYTINNGGNIKWFEVDIAVYAGVLKQDAIEALSLVYDKLRSIGIDLEKTGSVSFVHFTGSSENLLLVGIGFELGSNYTDGFYQFQLDGTKNTNLGSLREIPNLFPYFVPVGIAFQFPGIGGLYTRITGITQPIDSIYPSFVKFKNYDQLYNGGFYQIYDHLSLSTLTNFYFSNSVDQIRQAIETGIMSSALIDPASFCWNLIWKK